MNRLKQHSSNRTAVGLGLVAMVLGLALFASPTLAQKPIANSSGEVWPEMSEILILVQDKDTGEDLEPLRRGETLHLRVGQTVRLRTQAIPVAGRRSPRYPSATFTLLTGKGRVSISKADEDVGRVLVTATNTADRRNQETWIRFELIQPVTPAKLMRGNIQVVVDAATDQQPVQEAAQSSTRGATLYEAINLGGASETFYTDMPDLRSTGFGQDRASSVVVDEGCRVILYSDIDYGGRSIVLEGGEVLSLHRTSLGSNTLSSLRVKCD